MIEAKDGSKLSLISVRTKIIPVDGIPRGIPTVSHTPTEIRDQFKAAVQS
ncbi:MAG: hypothetical protein J4N69_09575 [Chloroflexi bacterium]|nr:hypothetical protein [Chloroflexota bacterium]